MNERCAYIIDLYNPYHTQQNKHIVFKCRINNIYYGVFATELSWGQPILDGWPADTSEFNTYHIFPTKEEAADFLYELKRLEGLK